MLLKISFIRTCPALSTMYHSLLPLTLFQYQVSTMSSNNSTISGRIVKGKNNTPRVSRKKSICMLSSSSRQQLESEYRKTLHRIRLQVNFTRVMQERAKALDENRQLLEETSRLRAILDSHSIPYDGYPAGTQPIRQDTSLTPPPEVARFGRTYNEIGIDFVLA